MSETDNPFAWKTPWSWQDQAGADNSGHHAYRPRSKDVKEYARRLKNVAANIRKCIQNNKDTPQRIEGLLRKYAEALDPWAERTAMNMISRVHQRNREHWETMSMRMGHSMEKLLNSPGVGAAVVKKIAENKRLIRSLPMEAADRVGQIVQENMSVGGRVEELHKEILKVADVSEGRARCIAHTEIFKASTALTQARAESVGSEGYIWRTSRDASVRNSHRAMEGRFVRWDEPQTLDNMTGHAGEFPNCHCYCEPVIPESDGSEPSYSLPTREMEMKAGKKFLLSHWEKQIGSTTMALPYGSKLPMLEFAEFNPRKTLNYSLDFNHPRGKDKALQFLHKLGITKGNADILEKQIMEKLPYYKAERNLSDIHGERFNVYIPVTGPNGRTHEVMTAWMYDREEDEDALKLTPRMINCFIDDDCKEIK